MNPPWTRTTLCLQCKIVPVEIGTDEGCPGCGPVCAGCLLKCEICKNHSCPHCTATKHEHDDEADRLKECYECKVLVCSGCRSHPDTDNNVTCSTHSIKCACGELYPNGERLKECDCGKSICDCCMYSCHKCNRLTCDPCLVPCIVCGFHFCGGCLVECPKCGEVTCHGCILETGDKCRACSKRGANLLVWCEVCNSTINRYNKATHGRDEQNGCMRCTAPCVVCARATQKTCMEECLYCLQPFCRNCMKVCLRCLTVSCKRCENSGCALRMCKAE